MDEKEKEKEKEMVVVHLQLGCYECRYADEEALGKRACCTFVRGPMVVKEGGRCTNWRRRVCKR